MHQPVLKGCNVECQRLVLVLGRAQRVLETAARSLELRLPRVGVAPKPEEAVDAMLVACHLDLAHVLLDSGELQRDARLTGRQLHPPHASACQSSLLRPAH